jgi:CBS domain-containing protein
MSTAPAIKEAHYVGPSFKDAKVHDAMRLGVVTCRPQTPLKDVARIMVSYQIHSVVVDDPTGSMHPWGIVTNLELAVGATSDEPDLTAGDVAKTEDLVTVAADESLVHAAQLMAEHGVSHLLAVQPETGRPVGVISALGIANVIAQS